MTEEEDGSWTIVAPDLPGMVAAAPSLSAALRRLPDAIDSWIVGAREAGIPVPDPTRAEDDYSGRFVLRVPKRLHRQLAEGAREEGVSLNSFCTTLLAEGIGRRQAPSVVTWGAAVGSGRSAQIATYADAHATWLTARFADMKAHYRVTELLPRGIESRHVPDDETEERVGYALSG